MAKADKSPKAAKGGRSATAGGGATTRPRPEHWKEDPDEHDYPAAHDYLSLLLGDTDTGHVVDALKDAAISHRKAKDLLRASRLDLLPAKDPEVRKDLGKVSRGERLSPVLLVRGSLGSDVGMTVADGYHRICASYHLDEDADIPCRIVDAPAGRTVAAAHHDGARQDTTTAESLGSD
jgi:hypothetical protein